MKGGGVAIPDVVFRSSEMQQPVSSFQSVESFWRSAVHVGVLALLVTLIGAATASAQVVVFAPHPDDEGLMASGIIYEARQSGKTVKVVIATNGDCEEPTVGHERQAETIRAMNQLGLAPSDVIFLGYADCGLREMYYYFTTPESQFTSAAGFRNTYANEGMGGVDYHTRIYGTPAKYSGYSLIQDLVTVLRNYKPQDIYVTSAYDANFDHYALNFMVIEATLAMMQADATFQPTVHEGLVHEPCELCDPSLHWPLSVLPYSPTSPTPMPVSLPPTPLSWAGAERVAVPGVMQLLPPEINVKSLAIAEYVTQGGSGPWMQSFVKSDEVFWKHEFWANLALRATATASSSLNTGNIASSMNDGAIVGTPVVPVTRGRLGEWISDNQVAGAWAQLTWTTSQAVTRVVLHDRTDPAHNITSGTLTFSDGSSISIGALPANGVELAVNFAQKNVTWIRFTATSGQGTAVGLSEFEVYGPPVAKLPWQAPSGNTAPFISSGPTAPSTITDSETAAITLAAVDTDNDPLYYGWTTSGGRIDGSGPNVTFVPPVVSTPTTYQVTVFVADGRGGLVSASASITVTPSGAPQNIAGQATATASSSAVVHSQTPDRAIDGIVSGYPVDSQREWVSDGQLGGAWIQLTWPTPRTISRSVLHDRINTSDRILSGTLRFSDGTTIAVGALPNDGSGFATDFPARTVSWIRFEIATATGGAAGLAEWEIFTPAAGTNVSPQITVGPTATPTSITDLQTTTLNVTAIDVDGDPLTYVWQATGGGSITGSGSSVTFNPPSVAQSTPVRVDVTVLDGRGGSIAGFVNVTVVPSGTSVNLASFATATASSENDGRGQGAAKAIDGFVDGYPTNATREWASVGQLAGAWIQLTWTTPQPIAQVVLYDRINTADQVLAGTLRFSDGSTVAVAALADNGAAVAFNFAPRSASWVRLEITAARGDNIGLAEFEVFAPSGPPNSPPQITTPASATPAAISDLQTTTLAVSAMDPDGDSLDYIWEGAGVTVLAGSSVTFTPPRVTTPTTFHVVVTVADGRGGAAQSFVDVLVTPSNAPLNLAPLSTVSASSENSGRGQDAFKAIDGVISGYPVDGTTEWATVGQVAGAWIRLDWSSPQTVSQIVLHDRINTEDNIRGATLTFSDGSSVPVGELPNDGAGLQIDFTPRSVTWVTLTVTSGRGENIGLAEIRVY